MEKLDQWQNWRLIIKLDPDKSLSKPAVQMLASLPADAIVVGGTQNITRENSRKLLETVLDSRYQGMVFQELSSPEAILPGVDGYLLPVVLNAGSLMWLKDAHLQAIKRFGNLIPWEKVLAEGYLVCNPRSAVGRKTGAGNVNIIDAAAYVTLAEKVFNLPVFYIEYSGRYGDVNLVKAVAGARENIHLFYGGGIDSLQHAKTMLEYVDTIIVGNLMYQAPHIVKEIAFNLLP